MKFSILVRECHYAKYEVEADSEEEARNMVALCQVEPYDVEYSHMIDNEPDEFTVMRID